MLLSLQKSFMQLVWMTWEKGFGFISRFRCRHIISFGICTIMIKKHKGEDIVCQDSTIIQQGDLIGELHLHNKTILMLMKSLGPTRAALKTTRLAGKALLEINEAFESRPEFKEVKAIVGITLLHRGLTHGLGFEQQPLHDGIFRSLTTVYLRLLLAVLHPDGNKRIGRRTELLIPVMLIHTRTSLKNKFSSGAEEVLPDGKRFA